MPPQCQPPKPKEDLNIRDFHQPGRRNIGVAAPGEGEVEWHDNNAGTFFVKPRVSKADGDAKNLVTQLGILADYGIREDLIFSDVASGRTMNRTGWLDLISRVQPGDTIVVAFLDRFSRNFEEGVRIQAELTGRDIGIVAIREHINTSDGSAAAKFFRRSMLAQGAYQWTRPANGSSWAWIGPGQVESKLGTHRL